MLLKVKILIGDSPAGPENGIARYWEKTGLAAVPEAVDSRLVNFEAAGTFHADIDGISVHISAEDVLGEMGKLAIPALENLLKSSSIDSKQHAIVALGNMDKAVFSTGSDKKSENTN